jgi:hypothetical protein
MYYGTSSGAPVSYGKMACHTICVSARVVNNKNFVKNLLNKKIIKISPKLTISEIIDEAVGDAEGVACHFSVANWSTTGCTIIHETSILRCSEIMILNHMGASIQKCHDLKHSLHTGIARVSPKSTGLDSKETETWAN